MQTQIIGITSFLIGVMTPYTLEYLFQCRYVRLRRILRKLRIKYTEYKEYKKEMKWVNWCNGHVIRL